MLYFMSCCGHDVFSQKQNTGLKQQFKGETLCEVSGSHGLLSHELDFVSQELGL